MTSSTGATVHPESELDKHHPAAGVLGAMVGAIAFAATILGLVLLTSA